MRSAKLLLLLCLFTTGALAQSAPQGIQPGDIDRSADPCDDFYQFANGRWRAENPIPASMVRWSRRFKSGEDTKVQLQQILEEAARKTDSPKNTIEQQIGDFYGACMDEKRINELGITPLQPFLAEIDKVKSPADLTKTIVRLHDIGVPAPFGVFANSDNHDPGQVVVQIAAGGLGLPDRDYYFKTEQRFVDARERYHAHVEKVFSLAGYSADASKAAANTIFAIETKLAENSLDNVALRDPKSTDHKLAYAEMKKLAPHFDWDGYFDGAHLPKGDLYVQEPKFLQEVDRQVQQTSLADWKTYLKWQLLAAAAPSLADGFVNEDFAFNRQYLQGAKQIKPRSIRCVESTDNLLGEALGKKYVEKYFPPEAKAKMQELVKNLLAAMKDSIETNDWMEPETRKKALLKVSTFNPKLGYPDKWNDYSSVRITRDAYWQDVVNATRWNVDDNRQQAGKPVDRGRWGLTPPTSNAYYNPLLNEIVFPAGILQPPGFNLQATDAVNYGAIGVVIGHEISHGFDDSGAQYAADGKLENWWTETDLKKFEAKGQCVVDQFDNYFIEPGIHHNGKLVLGESIGDLAGANIAYRAYQRSRQGKGPEPTIDGFTPEQQFFLAFGQWRGDALRPETQRFMVQGDPHPVGKYRVIGPFSNMPEFQRAFSCKAGSPMVRPADKRCVVW